MELRLFSCLARPLLSHLSSLVSSLSSLAFPHTYFLLLTYSLLLTLCPSLFVSREARLWSLWKRSILPLSHPCLGFSEIRVFLSHYLMVEAEICYTTQGR